MNDNPNEEREALIAGDRAGSLAADEAADLGLLAELLGDPSTWAEPNAGLEDRVVFAVEGAVASPVGVAPKVLVSAARTSSRRRRFLWPAASAAAAIAIVSGVAIGTLGGPSADFTAKLSATSVAPTASATANIRHNGAGFRITLDAHGLPKLPAGEYYQAWLKNAAGTLVPIGTFSSSDGRVTLWSGVSPQTFSGISVTIEATDGDQGSSGRRILYGRAS